MKKLFYFTIPIVLIISYIFFMQSNNTYYIVNAQTIENQIIQNLFEIAEKANSDVPQIAEVKNSSELIAMSIENDTKSIANNPTLQALHIEDIANFGSVESSGV